MSTPSDIAPDGGPNAPAGDEPRRDAPLFLDFFYNLREARVPVGLGAWVAMLEALSLGLHDHGMEGFYLVARATLVGSERYYDGFDLAFGKTFRGVEVDFESLSEQLAEWLSDPRRLLELTDEQRAALSALDPETLKQMFHERLAEQRKRHEGGNRWIGTGGTSPFGQGGYHPSGIRIGGQGGGRSALAVADARTFQELRSDRVLDTRQMGAALRKLRKLSHLGSEEELDLDATIDKTARNAGDLEIAMRPIRRNDLRVLLLFDVGGSMDPHAQLVERLFSAAKRSGGFKELRSYYFHNCVYGRVYENARMTKAVELPGLLRELDSNWILVMVGDAWMHPAELSMADADVWNMRAGIPGIAWLAKLADRFRRHAWLNPEARRQWGAPSIDAIHQIFPMYELTLDGLDEMVKGFEKPAASRRRAFIDSVLSQTAMR